MTLQDMHDSGVNQIPTSSPYTKMADIQISAKGIESLLKKVNPHKATGPDQLKPIVLQNLHKELAPILQVIFQRSIDQAKLSSKWKDANVSPIFKKGDKTDPANYRPISLTCVLCKVLEHMGLGARKPVFGGLRTTKAQTSLRIRAVWSAPLLFAYWKVSYLDLLQAKFQFSS